MEDKIEKGFKVVTRDLKSIIMKDADFFNNYKVGEFTTPSAGCGPLAVFKSFKSAMRFWNEYGGIIFPCEYIRAYGDRMYIPKFKDDDWNSTCVYHLHIHYAPSGTVLSKKVKILNDPVEIACQ
jgi:hypothetical protein